MKFQKNITARFLMFLIVALPVILSSGIVQSYPYYKPNDLLDLMNADIDGMHRYLLQPENSRDLWLKTWTHVYNFDNGSSWNLYENHEHIADATQNYQPWLEFIQRNNNGIWSNYQHYVWAYFVPYLVGSYEVYTYPNGYYIPYSRTVYEYNGAVKDFTLSMITSFLWQNNDWGNFSQSLYSYQADNTSIQDIISRVWQNNTWQNNSKAVYSYNTAYQISTMTFYTWSNNTWQLSSRMIYTYTTFGEYNTIISQIWSSTTSSYSDSSLISYTYNSADQCTQILYQIWQNSTWQNQMKQTYTYDVNGNNTELIRQIYNFGWINDERRTMEYCFLDVANTDYLLSPNPMEITVFPNPVKKQTAVKINSKLNGSCSIDIYNPKGQNYLHLEKDVKANQDNTFPLDVASLPSGVYIIKASLSGQYSIKRMLKLK